MSDTYYHTLELMVVPLLHVRICPVTHPDASLSRNAAHSATSSGRNTLPFALYGKLRFPSALSPVMSDAVTPGATALTLMSSFTNRWAKPRTRLLMDAFIRPYGRISATSPVYEDMNRIFPFMPLPFIYAATACAKKNGPSRFVLSCASKLSFDTSKNVGS